MLNLTSPAAVRALLLERGIKPKKRLGQNFLVNPGVLEKTVTAAGLSPGDTVVEIGPGVGALTARLAETAGKVIAVEVDRRLVALLQDTLSGYPNVFLEEADALQTDFDGLVAEAGGAFPYKVVANLPYYVTTPLLIRLLQSGFRIKLMVLTVQREVALRLVARPGTKEYGALSVFVQYKTKPDLVGVVSRGSFYPVPAVDSAIVRLAVRSDPAVIVPDDQLLFRIVRASFAKRRKTLLNALAGSSLGLDRETWRLILVRAGIDPQRRGETLTLEEFAAVARLLVLQQRE
ncbi:MAG TPA: 16S rRNA (adenine(1518)-N(6)/adenine(1519)-N(6))-dimethyltransferase RsmA [Desulfotomaculum sp.]|nr:16S rRNA (adenine(1518)-N(6)/adenine(1519)-N(6))-dimethyltransferase RsmA [Desulfotomaculum sp.]